MRIIRVLRGSLSKIMQDREDIRFERSPSWGGNRGSARGLQYTGSTFLTTVEDSCGSIWCCTYLRYFLSYLPSKTTKINFGGRSKHYSTPVFASAVPGVIYKYDLLTGLQLWYIRKLYILTDILHRLHDPEGERYHEQARKKNSRNRVSSFPCLPSRTVFF